MGKLDTLMRGAGANVGESMGAGRDPAHAMHGACAPGIPARLQGVTKSTDAAKIPIGKIVRDEDQPRKEFDLAELGRLAESLKQRGQLQPIRVRWDEGRGAYVIVCGERRWRAAQLAEMTTLTAIIMDGPLAPADRLAIQLCENCLRDDLKPVEQARAFKALMDQFGWTATQVGRELGIDQSSVSRSLKLLDLPEPTQALVEQGILSPATAYEASKIDEPEARQEIIDRAVTEGLTRAAVVEAVRARKTAGKGRGAKPSRKPPKVTSRTFRAAGCRVTVERSKGLDEDLIRAALADVLGQLGGGAEGQAA